MMLPDYRGMALAGITPKQDHKAFFPRWRIRVYHRRMKAARQYEYRLIGEAYSHRTVRSTRMQDADTVIPTNETLTKFAIPRVSWLKPALEESGLGAGMDPAGRLPAARPEGGGPVRQGIDVEPDMYIEDMSDGSWYRVDGAYPTQKGVTVLRCTKRQPSL